MNTSNDLWRLVERIRHATNLAAIDRELLRPVFAAHDDGQTIAVPKRIEARIRFYAAQQPK